MLLSLRTGEDTRDGQHIDLDLDQHQHYWFEEFEISQPRIGRRFPSVELDRKAGS